MLTGVLTLSIDYLKQRTRCLPAVLRIRYGCKINGLFGGGFQAATYSSTQYSHVLRARSAQVAEIAPVKKISAVRYSAISPVAQRDRMTRVKAS